MAKKSKFIVDEDTKRNKKYLHDLMQKVNPKMPLAEIERIKKEKLAMR